MTKNKSRKIAVQRKAALGNNNSTGRLIREARLQLDRQAQDYARLLCDPCHADLTFPTYPGSSGGILVRAEAYVTLFVGPAGKGGLFHWVPGRLASSGGLAQNLMYSSEGAFGMTPFEFGSTDWVPGGSITTSASSIRTVAACATIMWPGSELNRQGFVIGGNTDGGFFDVGTTPFDAGVANKALNTHMRMPNDGVEFVWRPNIADTQFHNPSEASPNLTEHSALTIAIQNLPANTGVRIRTVAVYEFIPAFTSGFATSSNTKNRSGNTLDHVLDALDRAGDWTVRVGMGMNRALTIANDVYSVGKAVGQIASRAAPLMLGM